MAEDHVKVEGKAASPSDKKNLLLRIASAAVLVPVALGGIAVGGPVYMAALWVLWAIGLAEWIRLSMPQAGNILRASFQIAFLYPLAAGFLLPADTGWMGLAGLFVLMAELAGYFQRNKSGYWGAAGLLLLGASIMAMVRLRAMPVHGLDVLLYLCLVVWGTDTGAYFAGRLIGGPKLAPKLSPKKTWAGLLGGMAFAAGFGYAVGFWFGWPELWKPPLWALALAVVAQIGDLFESMLKRRAGAKDSGTLIPGHGGVLDRVDGLIFAAIMLDAVIVFWGQGAIGLPPVNL